MKFALGLAPAIHVRPTKNAVGILLLATWAVLLPTLVCSQTAPTTITTPPESLQVQWRPIIHSSSVTTDEIFPAEILALASRPANSLPSGYFGDPNGFLGVMVTSPTPNARVRVTVTVDQLSEISTFDVTLPDANRSYEIWPKVRFDARKLATVRESFPTTAVFTLSVNEVPIGEESRTLRVRSVNDVPFAYLSTNGPPLDFSFLFAAFVNENSPVIDDILKQALSVNAVQSFNGYQRTPQDVLRQVFAVWNVLQRNGVKYSSITQPSGQSQTVFSQHVRFVDEVFENNQANCVDGSVLFASVLYKLGIYPALVMVPGHMFVGFFADSQKQQPFFLETTMIGSPGLIAVQRNWKFLTNDGYLSSESYRQFQRAVAAGNQQFQNAAPNLRAKTHRYVLLDVDAVRRAGISAIPRF